MQTKDEAIDIVKQTLLHLLQENASESVSVSPSGTSASISKVSIDSAIKALEFLQQEEARQTGSPGFKVRKFQGNSTR